MQSTVRFVRHLSFCFFAAFALACGGSKPPVEPQPAPYEPPEEVEKPVEAEPAKLELKASPPEQLGQLPEGTGLPAGTRAPAVKALDADGKAVSLRQWVGKTPVMLVFYRGGWCPYCNIQVHDLVEAYPEFEKRSVLPILVSVDQPAQEAKTKAQYTVPFPMLSDSDLKVHQAFKVVHQADEEEFKMLKGYNIDLQAYSGRDHRSFAVPAIFLISKKGVVRWSHADFDYQTRPSVEQLLTVIDNTNLKK